MSSTVENIEMILAIRINRSRAFSRAPRTASPILPGLILPRSQIVELLQKLAKERVKIMPFTILINAQPGQLPLSSSICHLEYLPASYNTPEGRALIPKQLQVDVEPMAAPSLASGPNSGPVLGGDDLRWTMNVAGVEQTFLDVANTHIRDATINSAQH
jgi:hypothetical protein